MINKENTDMKKLFIAISVFGLGAMLSSCNLELFPETGYNEGNVEVPEGPTESAIKTKADVAGERCTTICVATSRMLTTSI